MDVQRITGAFGAELRGLDLSQPIGPDLAHALRQALAEHLVLVIPGQSLDVAAQRALTQVFELIRVDQLGQPRLAHKDDGE